MMSEHKKDSICGGYFYTATLLLFLVLSIACRFLMDALQADKTVSQAVISVLSATIFIVLSLLYAKKDVKKLKIQSFSPIYLVPALMLAFGMLLGLGFLNSLVARGVQKLGGAVSSITIPLDTPFKYVLFSVCLCVLPAIAEETFFRGAMLDSLRGVGKLSCVFTVALCFALYHGNVVQIAYQFIYGVGLGFLTLKAKSVIPAMVAHFVNNFAVLTLEYIKLSVNFNNAVIIIIGSALLVNFTLFMIFYTDTVVSSQEKTESIKGFYIPFGAIGIAVAALMVILSVLPV